MTTITNPDRTVTGLWSTTAHSLSFAPSLEVRAFLLQREQGNLLVYSTSALEADADALSERGGVARQYLNHWHEAIFGLAPASLGAMLVHHEAETPQVLERGGRGRTFSRRRHHLDDDFEVIPTPGHTAGATAYLWDTGEHRLLFPGDSLYVEEDRWKVAVLESSDRDRYVASLELIRDLDFDVLVPWAAAVGEPALVFVGADERRARLDAVIDRVRGGAHR